MIAFFACVGVVALIGAAAVCAVAYLANIDGRLR